MAYPENQPSSFGQRASRALVRLVVTLLLLGCAGAAVFFMSQLNARTFSLRIQDGKLTVLKGRMMPAGAMPFRPTDPTMADAYAPLDLEGTTAAAPFTEQGYSDREALDRALFQIIETLAAPKVASDEPSKQERGIQLIRRAEKLPGLTEEQRRSLERLKAEVAFYQARSKLEDAQRLVVEGLTQLRLAAQSKNRHERSANQMLANVEEPAKALEEALRKAVHVLSAPPEEPAAPAAAAPAQARPDAGTAPQPEVKASPLAH
jgi:hypothetical protein